MGWDVFAKVDGKTDHRLKSRVFAYQGNIGSVQGGDYSNAYALGVRSSELSDVASIDLSTQSGANDALGIADAALQHIASQRATLGALQSRFEATVEGLQVSSENLGAARSRVEDADYAQETAALSRAQILQQAGTAMVAQANQLQQQVLTLLG